MIDPRGPGAFGLRAPRWWGNIAWLGGSFLTTRETHVRVPSPLRPGPRRGAPRADRRLGARYQFNYTFVSPLAVIGRVPARARVLRRVAERRRGPRHSSASPTASSWKARRATPSSYGASTSLLTEAKGCWGCGTVPRRGARDRRRRAEVHRPCATALATRPTDLAAYADLFRAIGLPPIASGMGDDTLFAHMRVAGPNPVMLKRVVRGSTTGSHSSPRPSSPASSLAISLAAAAAGGASVPRRLRGTRAASNGAPTRTTFVKYLYAPLALFVTDRITRHLHPVAIRCKQTPAPDNPIFTPDDGHNWRIAKTVVEIADGNFHEAVTHLARTHLLIEPFVVCTYRQLAPNHPLFVFLAPHFEGTLAINEAAWQHLIANKGAADQLFGGSIEARRAFGQWPSGATCSMRASAVPGKAVAARARGQHRDAAHISVPRRRPTVLGRDPRMGECALPRALLTRRTQKVQADGELLKAWMGEIGSVNGGRVSGFGPARRRPDARVPDRRSHDDPVHVQRTARGGELPAVRRDVELPPGDAGLAGYSPAPTSKTRLRPTRDPPRDVPRPWTWPNSRWNSDICSGRSTTRRSVSTPRLFPRPCVADPLARFQARSRSTPAGRSPAGNATRVPYTTLAPTGIPQSINI